MLCDVKRPAGAVMAFHNIKALNSLCGEWINHEVPLSISNIEPDIFLICEIVLPDRKENLYKTETAFKSITTLQKKKKSNMWIQTQQFLGH